MAVNWDLVAGRNFNPVGAFQQGYQGGQQMQRDKARKGVLARLAMQGITDPAELERAGIELMAAGDAQTGGALTGMASNRENRQFQRETRAEDVAHRDRSFAADQDYRTQSLGVQRAGQNKEPDIVRTMRAMGIDPQSPEARGYLKQPGAAGADKPSDIRGEIRSLPSYKAFSTVKPMYDYAVDSAKRDTRAADVALVFSFMKILDPNSVVRESEVSLAENVATLPQQYRAQIQSFLTGQGRLTPDVRGAIMQEAGGAVSAYEQAWRRDENQYRNIARSGGMPEDLVIPSFGTPGGQPQPGIDAAAIDAELRRRGVIP